jgi:hypothetical protein
MRRSDIRPPIPADPYAEVLSDRDTGDENPPIEQADGDSRPYAGTFDYCDYCCRYRMRPGSSYCSTACETAAGVSQ